MGITGLARLVADVAPEAVKEVELTSYFGRRIAIDASMSLYQFLIAIRYSQNYMTNDAGETTSHIVGFFYRTCKLLEAGIKPVYVFDGKPPVLKGDTLEKRKVARDAAMKKLEEAKEVANAKDMEKYTKRLVKVTRKHNEDVKKLLQLMGLPVIESPSEAEAQCAQLCKEGLVYGVATEDMDALTFGAPKLIRHLSSGTGEKVKEIDLAKTLKGFQLTHNQFIDLCILMGCDYCGSIKGIGPKKGLDLIQKHSSIENILKEKYGISEVIQEVEVVYSDRRERVEEVESSQDDQKANGENGEVKKETNSSGFKDIKEKIKESVDKEVKALFGKAEKDEVKTSEDEKKLFPGMDELRDISDDDESRSVDNNHLSDDSNLESKEDLKKELEDLKKDGEDLDDTDIESAEEEEEEVEEKSKKKKKSKKEAKPKRDMKEDVPENWLFVGARKLFTDANVSVGKFTEADLKIKDPDEEGLIKFLVDEHSFARERVETALKKIKTFKQKSAQSRIDTFFKVVPKEPTPGKKPSTATKRKNESVKNATAGKKGRKPK